MHSFESPEDVKQQMEQCLDFMLNFKRLVSEINPHLYERWKAGGFMVDSNIISHYPNVEEVYESIESDVEELFDNDEDDDIIEEQEEDQFWSPHPLNNDLDER